MNFFSFEVTKPGHQTASQALEIEAGASQTMALSLVEEGSGVGPADGTGDGTVMVTVGGIALGVGLVGAGVGGMLMGLAGGEGNDADDQLADLQARTGEPYPWIFGLVFEYKIDADAFNSSADSGCWGYGDTDGYNMHNSPHKRFPAPVYSSSHLKASDPPSQSIVNIEDINKLFKSGETVNPHKLVETKLISSISPGVKVLGKGKLSKKLTIYAHHFSKSAFDAIKKAGGEAKKITQNKK